MLLAIGVLILLGTSPVVAHHLLPQAAPLLAGREHLFRLCLVALHLLLAPVHHVAHLLLVVGAAYALWDRGRTILLFRRVLAQLDRTPLALSDRCRRAAEEVGLPPARVRLNSGAPVPAFTAGWWTPRVHVSTELVAALSDAQLRAVLAHEAAHVWRRDPLRLSLLRFFACLLFYLPALRRLADDAADEAEIAADDAAAAVPSTGGALVLASALVDVARRWNAESVHAPRQLAIGHAAVGLQRPDLLERRVRRLVGESTAVGTHLTRRSLAGAGLVLVAVWSSGLMMAHPLSGAEAGTARAAHCAHHGGSALAHLFCLGNAAHRRGELCPHAARG